MEDERFELLPAAAYVKGFLRSYGETLGLDGQVLVDEYTLRFEPRPEPAHEMTVVRRPAPAGRIWPKGRKPASSRRSEAQLLWLGIGGSIAVALLVWVGADNGERSTPIPAAPRVATVVAAPPAVTGAALPASPAASAASERVTLSATGVSGTNGSFLMVRRGGPNGPTIFEDTIPGGATRTFSDARRLWVRVGWTPGITLRVAGRPAATAAGTLNFLVTPEGLKPG
jgi:hypothetical protein